MALGLLQYYQLEGEMEFLARLKSLDAGINHYEDPRLREKALSLIPVSELKQRAKEASERSFKDGQDGVDEKDCLLLEILAWFGSFFHWMDKPVCSNCGTKTESNGSTQPTEEERRWEVGRVEAFKCPNCGKDERFPRFNHPEKLLETRCGRCGEIANCKALVLRAMGFEVRHVTDWTDHVWVEVYSESQQRWIHCDGGKCDENELYERWWGKKLTYIIAFSKEQVVDVTWRYSVKQKEVAQRRLLVREEWLSKTLQSFNDWRQQSLPLERKKALWERSARELAEFFPVYQGKLLGTAAWRRMIGKPESVHEPYTFLPTEEEVRIKCFRLSYCCARDKYFRGSNRETLLDGWTSGAAAVKSMYRNYEHDWTPVMAYILQEGVEENDTLSLQKGNAYLARLSCSPTGLVAWQVDFSSSGLVIDSVTTKALVITSGTGQVDWTLEGGDDIAEQLDFANAQETVTTSVLSGSKTLKLTATLSGGKGDVAWQQAQLFSQPIDSENIAFDLTVILRDP
ncbi:peptide-N(4)-(N-acetyl-beta-glucosaminyl)asparagine amidase-like [Montipora foliosa]|uniref:peptide-N(4)-(N-acetyl-beta- glucosaminyl)asparagine amidase-like n=1 Tax=Montipora foliosa TaxID=591990 RepID=UPI0035F16FC2